METTSIYTMRYDTKAIHSQFIWDFLLYIFFKQLIYSYYTDS